MTDRTERSAAVLDAPTGAQGPKIGHLYPDGRYGGFDVAPIGSKALCGKVKRSRALFHPGEPRQDCIVCQDLKGHARG